MLFLTMLSLVFHKILAQNSCPEAKGMENFDFKAYTKGRWFEIGRYNCPLENNADCVMFIYSTQGDDTICTLSEVVNKNIKSYEMKASLHPDAGTTGKLFYSSYKGAGVNATLYVLDTDYDNYAIFYNCNYDEVAKAPVELTYVKSRTPTISPEYREKVEAYLTAHPLIDETKMKWDHFTHDACMIDV